MSAHSPWLIGAIKDAWDVFIFGIQINMLAFKLFVMLASGNYDITKI